MIEQTAPGEDADVRRPVDRSRAESSRPPPGDPRGTLLQPPRRQADVVRHVGFSPLVDPIDGHRWPDARFQPGWDYLADRGGWFELIVTFGSTFAYILLIADCHGAASDLKLLCRSFISHGTGAGDEC